MINKPEFHFLSFQNSPNVLRENSRLFTAWFCLVVIRDIIM